MLGAGDTWGGGGGGPWDGLVGVVDLMVGVWIGFFISCLVGSLVLQSGHELPMMMNSNHMLLPFS